MHSTWMSFRSLTADQSVKNQKLKPGTISRITRFAIPYKISLIFFMITVVIDAFLIIASPLLLRKLIDDGVIPKDFELVTSLAVLVGIIAILDAVFSMIGRWFSARIGEGLIYDLRKQVFEHVQRQSIAFFTRTQTGALISRLNSDVIGAQQAFTSTLSGVVSNSLSLLLVIITMLTLSWQITLVSLVLLPVFLIPTKWVGRKLQGLTRQSFDINAQMSSNMTERFNVTVGTLLAITALLARLYGPLTALSNVRVDVMSALVSFERVFEVLDLQPMVTDSQNAKMLKTDKPEVTFDSVCFTYPSAKEISLASLEAVAKPELVESGEVLKNISFTVLPGTLTGIVGPSGAGKSTISSLN